MSFTYTVNDTSKIPLRVHQLFVPQLAVISLETSEHHEATHIGKAFFVTIATCAKFVHAISKIRVRLVPICDQRCSTYFELTILSKYMLCEAQYTLKQCIHFVHASD